MMVSSLDQFEQFTKRFHEFRIFNQSVRLLRPKQQHKFYNHGYLDVYFSMLAFSRVFWWNSVRNCRVKGWTLKTQRKIEPVTSSRVQRGRLCGVDFWLGNKATISKKSRQINSVFPWKFEDLSGPDTEPQFSRKQFNMSWKISCKK